MRWVAKHLLGCRSQRAIGLAVLAVTLTVAAGCGGGGGSKKSSPHAGAAASPSSMAPSSAAPAPVVTGTAHVAACDLVTKDEAAAILGGTPVGPITTKQSTPVGTSSGCLYRRVVLSPRSVSLVSAAILALQRGPSLYQQYIAPRGKNLRPVSGLGDRADFDPVAGAVFVLQGQTIFFVQVVKASKPAAEDVVLPLAHRASDRLH